MAQIKILLADSDWNIGPILKSYLEKRNFVITLATDGAKAYDTFEKGDFDFCIFEVVLPTIDGFELTQKIRTINSKVPIMFLSSRTEEVDKIKAFEYGADDYLTKPFSMAELILRIAAISRRCLDLEKDDKIIQISNFTFDNAAQQLVYKDPQTGETTVYKLTIKETKMLHLFAKNIGVVVSREEALSKVWNNETYLHARSMDVYVTRLRRLLDRDPNIKIINQHGLGFKLEIVNQ
ncbi:MAG: response regulator transcription factor [Bacteroidales bacterium]|jgi:DNA-binding response OmpR family regulator|nr:response regulator transcription factor [Bacteroidales bacterium]